MVFHVLNRGVARMQVFEKAGDYQAFERVLKETLEEAPMRICAYCLMPSHWHMLVWPEHDGADWRPAAEYARHTLDTPETPILCISPYIEAQPPVWRPDYPMPGFLYAQLVAYPLRGREYLLPFQPSDEARGYMATLAINILPRFRRFLIYGSKAQAEYWREWLAGRPDFETWRSEKRDFGGLRVIVFDR